MPVIPYSSTLLDRAEHVRGDAARVQALLAESRTRLLCFRELDVAMRSGPPPDLAWVTRRDVPDAVLGDRFVVFLGIDDDEIAHFALPLQEEDQAWCGSLIDGFVDARSAGLQLLDERAAVVAFARSVLAWHARRVFCSLCAGRNEPIHGGMQLKCANPACGAVHFPRTDPVVIMLVQSPDAGDCLLGRSPHYPPGLVSALAGFVEPGESIEDAVRREVREEAGIGCTDIRYFASQPWPFPSNLMIGCFATAVDTTLLVDETELEWARWFSRAEARDLFDGRLAGLSAPQPIAIAHYLLREWLQLAPIGK